MVSGALPDEVSETTLVAVCPTATDPNGTVVLLKVNEGVPTFS